MVSYSSASLPRVVLDGFGHKGLSRAGILASSLIITISGALAGSISQYLNRLLGVSFLDHLTIIVTTSGHWCVQSLIEHMAVGASHDSPGARREQCFFSDIGRRPPSRNSGGRFFAHSPLWSLASVSWGFEASPDALRIGTKHSTRAVHSHDEGLGHLAQREVHRRPESETAKLTAQS